MASEASSVFTPVLVIVVFTSSDGTKNDSFVIGKSIRKFKTKSFSARGSLLLANDRRKKGCGKSRYNGIPQRVKVIAVHLTSCIAKDDFLLLLLVKIATFSLFFQSLLHLLIYGIQNVITNKEIFFIFMNASELFIIYL